MTAYKRIRKLGEGGMGEVWLVMNIATRALFAEKALQPGLIRAKDLERFKREIEALSVIHHDHVIRIVEIITTGSSISYVMEYCPDGNLDDYFVAHPDADLWSCILQLAKAVAHIHETGFIHRDIKPQNVLMGVDGQVRLTDFGLVISADPARPVITTSSWVSYGFSPPEQFRDMASVTARGDIYAIGAVWYFLATRRLFDFDRSIDDQLEDVGLVERAILRRTLARDPVNRFASAKELVDALSEAIAANLRPFFAKDPTSRAAAIHERFECCYGQEDWIDGWDIFELPSVKAFANAVLKYEVDAAPRRAAEFVAGRAAAEIARIAAEMEQDNPPSY